MRLVCVLLLVLLLGCDECSPRQKVVLPHVPPDTVVIAWSVISRSNDRDSVHAVLEASRTLTSTRRSPDGTMISTSATIPKEQYAALIGRLRELDCCQLASASGERADPAEAQPILQVDLGDVRCQIELWDHQWREGLARECAVAFVQVHRSDFVPDPPVDAPPP